MLKAALQVLAAASLASAAAVSPATAAPSAPALSAPGPSAPARSLPAPAPDTGPCGPVSEFDSWDWFSTTTNPFIAYAVEAAAKAENWHWRVDDNTLWRGDTRENVEELFQAGFTPRGDQLTPLAEYIVKGGGQTSAHLSTSCEKWVAEKFATYGAARTGWVYEIEAPGGIDVNSTAWANQYESPYLWNKEIDFPGGVEGRFIKQACKIRLLSTDPVTKVNTYENLGCKDNRGFAPFRAAEEPALSR
nr:hypothetical protein [Streptomyces sp. DSM 41633]